MPVWGDWQPLFLIASWTDGADAFSGGVGNEGEEVGGAEAPGGICCGGDGLREIEASTEEEVKECFEFGSVLAGEALTAEADDV